MMAVRPTARDVIYVNGRCDRTPDTPRLDPKMSGQVFNHLSTPKRKFIVPGGILSQNLA